MSIVGRRCRRRIGVDDGWDKRWVTSWIRCIPMPALSKCETPILSQDRLLTVPLYSLLTLSNFPRRRLRSRGIVLCNMGTRRPRTIKTHPKKKKEKLTSDGLSIRTNLFWLSVLGVIGRGSSLVESSLGKLSKEKRANMSGKEDMALDSRNALTISRVGLG